MDRKGKATFDKLISCQPGHVRGLKNAQTAVGEIRFGDALGRLGDEEREMIEADLRGSDASIHAKVERTVAHGLLRWLAEVAQTMRENDSDARGSLAMLNQLADLQMTNGDYKIAAELLTEEKAIRNDGDSERHKVLLKLAHAHLLQETPNVREAQRSMEEARSVNGRQLAESDKQFIDMLLLEGAVHEANGEMQNAFNKFGKAKELLRSNDVDDHDAELEAMRRQAFALAKAGAPSDAKDALEAAKKEHISTLGQGHEHTLAVQEALAGVLMASGIKRDLTDAVGLLRDAQKARQALHGEKHVKTLEVTEQLGELLAKQGQHAEATEHLRAAYRARKAAYGPSDVSTINSATKLATALQGSAAASGNILGALLEDSPRDSMPDSSKGRKEFDALVEDIEDGKEDVLRQCLASSEGPTAKRAAALNLARLLRVRGKRDDAARLEKEHKAPAPITLAGPAPGSPRPAAEPSLGSRRGSRQESRPGSSAGRQPTAAQGLLSRPGSSQAGRPGSRPGSSRPRGKGAADSDGAGDPKNLPIVIEMAHGYRPPDDKIIRRVDVVTQEAVGRFKKGAKLAIPGMQAFVIQHTLADDRIIGFKTTLVFDDFKACESFWEPLFVETDWEDKLEEDTQQTNAVVHATEATLRQTPTMKDFVGADADFQNRLPFEAGRMGSSRWAEFEGEFCGPLDAPPAARVQSFSNESDVLDVT